MPKRPAKIPEKIPSKRYKKISKREAVIKGYDCLKKGEIIPEI